MTCVPFVIRLQQKQSRIWFLDVHVWIISLDCLEIYKVKSPKRGEHFCHAPVTLWWCGAVLVGKRVLAAIGTCRVLSTDIMLLRVRQSSDHQNKRSGLWLQCSASLAWSPNFDFSRFWNLLSLTLLSSCVDWTLQDFYGSSELNWVCLIQIWLHNTKKPVWFESRVTRLRGCQPAKTKECFVCSCSQVNFEQTTMNEYFSNFWVFPCKITI